MKTKITLTIALLAALASLYQGRKAYDRESGGGSGTVLCSIRGIK